MKSSKVFITTKSTLASLLFKGLTTKRTIPEAWTSTIKKHNSRPITKRTYEGTTSARKNNNEERNAPMTARQNTPMTANQGATFCDA